MSRLHFTIILGFLGPHSVCLAQEPPALVIQTVAGTPRDNGDGGPATKATLKDPEALAFDGKGTLYIADGVNLRTVSSDGLIRTIAGTDAGDTGHCPGCRIGDGGPALYAPLSDLRGVAVDRGGNIYFSDRFHRLFRKISPAGILSTVAPAQGYAWSVAVDRSGNVYVGAYDDAHVWRITPDGAVENFAGTGEFGFSGDNGPATTAQIRSVVGLAFDDGGNLYLADQPNYRVRKVTPDGIITTVAGDGSPGFGGEGGPATAAQIGSPNSVAVDRAGNLYIVSSSENRSRIFRVDAASNVIHAITVRIGGETDMTSFFISAAIDTNDVLYLADIRARRILKVATDGSASIVAGATRFRGDGGLATAALLFSPAAVLEDGSRNLYIADSGNHRIRRVSTDGIIRTVAGTGVPGFNGDGSNAGQLQLSSPKGLAFDPGGNLLIADSGNHRIRKLTAAGALSTVAGTGTAGYSGDNGPATSAQLKAPSALAAGSDGSVYIADAGNFRIRKIDKQGVISSAAGTGERGSAGDGGPAQAASLGMLSGLAIDVANNLYLLQEDDSRIRKIDGAGIISTISVDRTTNFQRPAGLAVDTSGMLYVADSGHHRICKVTTDGKVSTTAGSSQGLGGSFGDGMAAAYAQLYFPAGVALGKDGGVLVADSGNHLIRKLEPAQAYVKTIANAASFQAGPVVPGEYVSLFGVGIGPTRPVTSPSLDLLLGETRVTFDGVPSPLRYVSATQINAVVPHAVDGKSATQVVVEYQGKKLATVSAPVAAAAPGVFAAAIINQDGSVNGPLSPAPLDSVITLFATGTGQTDPPGLDARQPQPPVFPKPLYPIAVTIGGPPFGGEGEAAPVIFAGLVYPGIVQLNVRVPATLQPGQAASLKLTAAGISVQANNLRIFIK